jgi:hypothetical protein
MICLRETRNVDLHKIKEIMTQERAGSLLPALRTSLVELTTSNVTWSG